MCKTSCYNSSERLVKQKTCNETNQYWHHCFLVQVYTKKMTSYFDTFKQMVTFRTCVVHSTRRPVHFLDQFGPRPCKYKCKKKHPCTSQSLPSSHRMMTVAHRSLPSKRFKRGVLKPLLKRMRFRRKTRL